MRFLKLNGLRIYEMYRCVNLGLVTCIVMWLLMMLIGTLLPMSLVLHIESIEMQRF